MKTSTKIISLLASVTLLTACGNKQKPCDCFTNDKEPQTTQTTQSTETSKQTETSETTEQQTEAVTKGAFVVNYSDYMESYTPQLGGTYPVGTKAFIYTYMQGKTYVHTAVIPLESYDAGVAIFESQREATLFTQWINSVSDTNTMKYDMQTNLDYFYKNVYTKY